MSEFYSYVCSMETESLLASVAAEACLQRASAGLSSLTIPLPEHDDDSRVCFLQAVILRRGKIRNTPSTAGNSMADSERPSPEPLLKKEASPAVLGGENSGNALEASHTFNYRVWGIPAVLSRGNSRKRSESVYGVFPEFFRNFFRKVPAVLGVWPRKGVSEQGQKPLTICPKHILTIALQHLAHRNRSNFCDLQ